MAGRHGLRQGGKDGKGRMMRNILHICVILGLLPLPAMAETPMTGAEFEAYSTGKTLTYAIGGSVWGTEQYKTNRQVMWAFTDDECRTGYWYEQADQICFIYDDPNDPKCWWFYLDANGLRARFATDPPEMELSEVANSDEPMGCLGPDVGV